MKGSPLWTSLVLAAIILGIASAEKNVTEVVEKLEGSKADAIAADSILGQIEPLFSGYASLNQEVRPPPAPTSTLGCSTGRIRTK